MKNRWQALVAGRGWAGMLGLFVLCGALLAAGWVHAQGPTQDVDTSLDATRAALDKISRQLDAEKLADGELTGLRKSLLTLQQSAAQVAIDQAPELASAQARLAELGPVPAEGGEAPDVAKQRRSVEQSVSELDARVKLARLLAVESEQLGDKAADLARTRFQAHLFERTDSLLSHAYWQDLGTSLARDGNRLRGVLAQVAAVAAVTPVWTMLVLLLLVAGAVVLRLWLMRVLTRFEVEHVPRGRVRRSSFALAYALLAMLVPGTLAFAVTVLLDTGPGGSASLHALFGSLVGASCFSAYITGISQAVLSPKRSSWRMLPLSDTVARGLRAYPLLLGLITFFGWLAQQVAGLAQSDLATVVAINTGYALLLGLLMASALSRGGRLHRLAVAGLAGEPEGAAPPKPLWLTFCVAALWLLLVLSLAGMLMGYVALGAFVVRQVAWVLILALSAYVITAVIDDAANDWLVPVAARQQAEAEADDCGDPASERLAAAGGRRQQVALLLSAALRLTIVLVALVLVLAPFGEGPRELFKRTDQLVMGITIGELQLRPTAVLQAVLVFLLASTVLRALKRWTMEEFLPTTSMDAGMRTSVTTLLGFIGTVIAIALSLSAVGLALEKVAWIASALSVGIGFGLQAVVSNFVSGLILLAEQPVKVGDWVALGGVEGDIRRISVRATEIEMGDRSTLIVPNSEFITKVVRNVTRHSPLGLVQIKLPMPLSSTDPDKVTELLLAAFTEHPDVLEQPAPSVFLDAIADGSLVFNATGFVSSPRAAYKTRSALLYTVLRELREAGQPIWRAPSMVLRDAPAPAAPDPGIQTSVRGTPDTPG
ncbi:MAG TPA: DUF3772 domain-containing protein [Ideonella sp.]|uniref:DUF3772 domain-containing protein n=1 Tax=Ideonella sp. TaxID=1929293 RepID=UPI002BC51DAB|nr:DUF3772 domain-containing protein [Ideonella sp.]HSI49504.1 DUF3772 domain-containing protein [Ideonella sp.]